MQKIIYLLGIFFCGILLYSCANMSTPSGGYKDIRKPRIRFSNPKNQSLFVKGNQIVIRFDEDIELNNIKSNLVIIPNMENDYTYQLKKSTLTLTFDKPFAENTTYILIFDDAVQDITEKNKGINLRLAFSTGSAIDSLRMNGFVQDMNSNKPEKEAVVALYNALDTFKVEKHKPLYYAKTDTTGRYVINNIKKGKYFMYALVEDKKKNLIYDEGKEKIGFLADTLTIDEANFAYADFVTLLYDYKPFKISNKRPRKQYFEAKANKNIFGAKVEFADKNLQGKILYNTEKDILRFYNNTGQASTDSLLAYVTLKDSLGNQVVDTMQVKFDAIKAKDKKIQPLTVKIVPQNGTKFVRGEDIPLKFTFSVPVTSFATDSLLVISNKDTLQFSAEDFMFDSLQTSIQLKKPLKMQETMSIKYKKRAFISVENDSVKSGDELSYAQKKAEDFARLSGIVRTKYPHFILQLLNEKNEVEQQRIDEKEFLFEYVQAGKKKFRLIVDSNANGKWDMGDFKTRTIPEKILFFTDERLENTSPNWDYEDIIIEVKEE